MKESSSCPSPKQSPPRPSSAQTSSLTLSSSTTQVEVISRALRTASTLGRVRRESLALRDPPETRQVLERTLKKNLHKRLSEISLVDSAQESSQSSIPNLFLNPPEETFPRTSSPFNHVPNPLAPGTPISPSNSFNSVFFPNTPDLPAPIQPPQLILPVHSVDTRSESPPPTASLVDNAMSVLEDKEKALKVLYRRISAKMSANPINVLSRIEMTPLYQEEEKKLVALFEELDLGAQEILEDHEVELGDTRVNAWKAKVEEVKTNMLQYRQGLAAEVEKLKRASALTIPQPTGPIHSSEPLAQTLPINSSTTSSFEQERLDLERQKQRRYEDKIRTEAESRLNAVLEDTKRFAKKFPAIAESWTLEDNVKIEMAMKDINNWEKQMANIMKESRDVEILSMGNSLADPDDNIGAMKQKVTSAQKLMDNSIRIVKELDESRNLNSLGTRRSEHVKFPQFSGKVGEDFVTFKRKVEKAFNSNGVPTDDQVEKLRENLRDGAKLVVPEGTTNIERAWELLEVAFGGEDKVMQNRKDKLLAMGALPEASARKGGQSRRVTWCLELERVLAEIIELGNRNDELAREAFSKSTINLVIGLFPANIRRDMIKAAGEGSDKLTAIIDIIEDERAFFQEDEQFVDKKGPGGGKHGTGVSAGHTRSKHGDSSNLPNPRGYQSYRGATRMPSCRICKTLEARGDTALLYEDHWGNYPTGCPRFATMTTEQRYEITKESKMCLRCLDPKANWVFREGHKDCQVSRTKKNRFSCTNSNCGWHSWICSTHKSENTDMMNRFSADLAKKGISFVFHNALLGSSPSTDEETTPLCAQTLKSNSKNPNSVPAPKPQPWIRDTSNDLTREEAVDKLLKLTPNGTKLDTADKGTPMFMFGSAEGKKRRIRILYDTGCSDLLMKDGVPGVELEGIKVQQGPFVIGAVGGVQVMAMDAWMVKVKMMDGGCHVLEGLSVNKVTSDFPKVDLTQAINAVKSSKPEDKTLQNVKIPSEVGGEVDILLGIKYNALFPVLIHMLPTGLAVYKVRVKSFKNKYTAVIAGPHSSFDVLRNKVGNTAYLLQQFEEGLQNWRSLGSSGIKDIRGPPMTEKDMSIAMHLNQSEVEYGAALHGLVEEYDRLCDDEVIATDIPSRDKIHVPVEVSSHDDIVAADGQEVDDSLVARCVDCGVEFESMDRHVSAMLEDTTALLTENKESVSSIKKLVEAQDKGLQIEYRCPTCRKCTECLKPIETERISLREEAEVAVINESVQLDLKNKRIICSLPLRGKEEEFLSSNREQAEKILNQQCSKYFRDDATKPVILKAFNKLFDNGHAKLFKDLAPEVVEKILSKKVQHYIPWRVVFKESVSTPARPVLDASSNTPLRPDGTGGRSLNDACMKGRIPDMNLLRMVLRFMVGRCGFAGDLSQFYNVFKLIEEQWNLQLFLWKDDLNPAAETLVGVIRTLIYGVKSVAAQSEAGVNKLAKYVKDEHPELAEFLTNSRYVDDLGDSDVTVEKCKELTKKADELFAQVGMTCKDWSYSGEIPSDKVSPDGRTVSIGGMYWSSEIDSVECKIPSLHFGSVARGRIKAGTELFEGAMEEDMEKFVPLKVTPRQIASKYLSFYDILQISLPVTAGMKRDLRRVMKETDGWDVPITPELRSAWVKNLWTLERMKGLKYMRAKMPEDAIDEKMRMLVLVDAAKMLIVAGVWVGFKLKSGGWSCSFLIGRALLTAEDSTTPKDELNSLACGGNMCYIVRESLKNWVSSYALCGDSTIALHWLKSDKLKLSLFHRNRVVQLRRTTDLENVYHVITSENLADLPTRPDKVTIADVGPLSAWHNGLDWMKRDLAEAMKEKILTPLAKLSMPEDLKEDYDKGFVFDKTKDILTRGHVVTKVICGVAQNKDGIDLVYSRAATADYLLLPTKYNFPSVVRIVGIVWKFLKSFKCRKGKLKIKPRFHMLTANNNISYRANLSTVFLPASQDKEIHEDQPAKAVLVPTDDDMSDALAYLFKIASKEVKEFVKPEIVQKLSVERDGILYSKSRILEGQRFILSGDLEDSGILADQGILIHTPVIERFSPLAYAIGQWMHDK